MDFGGLMLAAHQVPTKLLLGRMGGEENKTEKPHGSRERQFGKANAPCRSK